MKRTGFAIPATICTASALIAAGGLAALSTTRSPETAAAQTAAAAAPSTTLAAANGCVMSFSKDICDSLLVPGTVVSDTCVDNGQLGRVTRMTGGQWTLTLVENTQTCSVEPCDEVPEKSGVLTAKVRYTQNPTFTCRYRACISGTWILNANDGTVYRGTLAGTIGAGTHRPNQCSFGGRDCEECLDVELLTPPTWRLGTEIAFTGTRTNGIVSPGDCAEELCFTLSGDFLGPDFNGRLSSSQPWSFAGTADGIHIGCNN